MDDKEIVSAIRAALADKVGQERFELWLGGAARLSVRGETLLVELASRFAQDWVRSHFRRDIEAACAETLGKPLAVEFAVDPALAPTAGHAAKRPGRHASPAATELVGDGALEGSVALAERRRRHGSPASHAAHAATAVLDQPEAADCTGTPGFVRRRFASLDQYVVGPSNRLAHASAQMAAEQPGRVSPLLVYGATGVGKTHLLEGIWTAARRRRAGIHAVYLSAEQFTTYFLEALHGSGLPSFRRKYRGVELLIVDGLQFFAGKRATLVELLHTTDTLLREGRQLVFAADRSPATLRELGEEFLTRLSSGIVCGIEPPDFQTRLGILRQMAQTRHGARGRRGRIRRYAFDSQRARTIRGAKPPGSSRPHDAPTAHPLDCRRGAVRNHSPQRPAGSAGGHRAGRLRTVRWRPSRCNQIGGGRMFVSRECWRCIWPESSRGRRYPKLAAISAAAATARWSRRKRT